MKRNSLTTAIVAGIAGIAGFAGLANAVDLNPDGLGQALVQPFYTAAGVDLGTDDRTAIAKVRFLEGNSAREVADYNLYLPTEHTLLYNSAASPALGELSFDDIVAASWYWRARPSPYGWDFAA